MCKWYTYIVYDRSADVCRIAFALHGRNFYCRKSNKHIANVMRNSLHCKLRNSCTCLPFNVVNYARNHFVFLTSGRRHQILEPVVGDDEPVSKICFWSYYQNYGGAMRDRGDLDLRVKPNIFFFCTHPLYANLTHFDHSDYVFDRYVL